MIDIILRKLLMKYDQELSQITGNRRQFASEAEAERWLKTVIDGENELRFCGDKTGFIIYQNLLKFTYIIKLYVRPAKRRKGIASRLLKGLKEPILLECHQANHVAQDFYKKLDFKALPIKGNDGNNWLFKGQEADQWLAAVLAQQINHD